MSKKDLEIRMSILEHNVNLIMMNSVKNSDCKEEKRFRTIQRTVSGLQDKLKEKDIVINKLKAFIDEHIGDK